MLICVRCSKKCAAHSQHPRKAVSVSIIPSQDYFRTRVLRGAVSGPSYCECGFPRVSSLISAAREMSAASGLQSSALHSVPVPTCGWG